MKNDGCLERTASQKKEAGVTVYLMEELGDARMRCDQLVRYITEAFKLIESSGQREQLFEVGGHLIHAIPDALFRLQKALQAVALAADRLDYEELKNDLRPEKVQELERVLQEVRIRNVQHRSQPFGGSQDMKNAADWKLSTDEEKESRFEEGKPADPTENMSPEDAKKWKSENEKNKDNFKAAKRDTHLEGKKGFTLCGERAYDDTIVESVKDATCHYCKQAWEKQHKSAALVWKIDAAAEKVDTNRLERLVDAVQRSGKEMDSALSKYKSDPGRMAPQLDNLLSAANSAGTSIRVIQRTLGAKTAGDEEKESRFEEGKPADPTENMSPEDAKRWKEENEKNKDNFKSAADDDMPKEILPAASEGIERIVAQARKVSTAGDSKKMFFAMLGVLDGIAQVGRAYEIPKIGLLMQVRKEMVAYSGARPTSNFSASEDDKRSKFEEGKPADPTENMSEEDAKKWKLEHLKNKDNFKSALDWKAEAKKLLDKRKGTDQDDLHYRAYLRAIIDGQPAEHLAKKHPGAQAAKEDLIDETGKAPKTAADVTKEEWVKALKNDEASLRRLEETIKKLEAGEEVENYNLAAAKAMVPSLKQVIENKKKLISKLANEVDPLAWKVAFGAPGDWKETKSDTWQLKVQYAGGPTVAWEIKGKGEEFTLQATGVEKGVDYKAKKTFDSLEAAQKYAKPYLAANGLDNIEKAFKRV